MPTLLSFSLRPLHRAIRASLLGGVIAIAAPPLASAQANLPAVVEKTFDIAAGPLDRALNEFAVATGVELSVDAALTEGKVSPGLRGNYDVRRGFDALLDGTGLDALEQGDGRYSLRVAPPREGVQSEAVLKAVKVQAALDHGTEGTKSYAAKAVSIGKGTAALREVPQSVTVMTRQRIEDQALYSLAEVLDQTPGVSASTNGVYGPAFTARGLTISKIRYDGGAPRGNANWSRGGDEDMAQFDHVEILRGADGLFSAAGEAGGVINLNYKRPQVETHGYVELTGGRWDNHRIEFDITGPLTESKNVRGRFVAAYQDRDFFYDYGARETQLFYGSLEVDLSESLLLFAGISHQRDKEDGTSWGLARNRDGSMLDLPRSASFSAPWSEANTTRTMAFVQFEQQFGSDWLGRLRVENNEYQTDHNIARLGDPVEPANPQVSWWALSRDDDSRSLTVDMNVEGGFEWLGRRHDVLAGMDYTRIEGDYLNGNPVFGSYTYTNPYAIVAPPEPAKLLTGGRDISDVKHGVYASLRLRPIEDWSVLLGGRYTLKDEQDWREHYPPSPAWRTVTDQDHVFIPYYGLIYDITDSASVYASTTEIYTSQATYLSGPPPGSPLDPVRGTNYEVGFKQEFANGLNASIALYRVEKKGMGLRDPAYPVTPGDLGASCCYYRDGYQLSEGVDAEINGELLPGWQIAAGYTYNDNINKRSGDVRFSTVTPRHLFKLWSNYRLPGDWSALRVGAGVVAQSSSFRSGTVNAYNPVSGLYNGAVIDYRFMQGGYAVWSAHAEYTFNPQLSVSVNVDNLFDKAYLSTVGTTASGNYYGDPRNLTVRLRAKF